MITKVQLTFDTAMNYTHKKKKIINLHIVLFTPSGSYAILVHSSFTKHTINNGMLRSRDRQGAIALSSS